MLFIIYIDHIMYKRIKLRFNFFHYLKDTYIFIFIYLIYGQLSGDADRLLISLMN
jgi:hypothetical protein